jgi:glycosyltransferase involved in cell wall biosynthesis
MTSTTVRQKIVIVTGDPLGIRMAGPAIRAWNIALVLSQWHDVRLVSFNSVEDLEAPFTVAHAGLHDQSAMAGHELWADILIVQGNALALFECLANSSKFLVVDIYDPMHLEALEQSTTETDETRNRIVIDTTRTINHQLFRGDFFLCASERQRDFWLGQLAALGRVNIPNYLADSDFRKLIDIAPFGLSDVRPAITGPGMRSVIPGIAEGDKVVLWGGGLYDWFDPFTLVRAIAQVSKTHPDIRLVFMGVVHPNKDVPEMKVVSQTRELARSLGVLGKHVFLNETWVPYEERANFLLEADAGVSTHHHHVETRYSFRTRILDYLWAGLPIITTDGDAFGDIVLENHLGHVVHAEDVNGLAQAIISSCYHETDRESFIANVEAYRAHFFWSNTLAPIVRYCAAPYKAADRPDGHSKLTLETTNVTTAPPASVPPTGVRADLGRALSLYRTQGARAVFGKIRNRMSPR